MGEPAPPAGVEAALRAEAPRVLGVLARRDGDVDTCEDAVQEALLEAAGTWGRDGIPDNPTGWLITVAARRLIDIRRRETARRRRELDEATPVDPTTPTAEPAPTQDDTLMLLWWCAHPALTTAAQVSLTLRAVGGLATAEIARALLVPTATVAQRISRAKARIRAAGGRFGPLTAAQRAERLPTVLQVLYLVFNEGYTASSGDRLHRVDLTREAIRLVRQLHADLPDHTETAGLLALMLLTDARRPARTRDDGALVPLPEQDRGRWDHAMIAEGTALITATLPAGSIGPYQLQAAIAAVHDEAVRADDTDWPQILALYGLLAAVAPSPVVTLNRLVALSMVDGPAVALTHLDALAEDPAMAGSHRVDTLRAHLLEELGDTDGARRCYERAARRTHNRPEQLHLLDRARRLGPGDPTSARTR